MEMRSNMSRHTKELMSDGTIGYGYDPPLKSYFFQVLDKDGDVLIDNNCSGIELAGWLVVLFGYEMDDITKEHTQRASQDMEI
tara:strand:- start:28 stop:276 length:249 start_codon:yes stop_codon:yes gene_type:complete